MKTPCRLCTILEKRERVLMYRAKGALRRKWQKRWILEAVECRMMAREHLEVCETCRRERVE